MKQDKNLLFGVLAVQKGYITQFQLIESAEIWTENQGRNLEDILLDKGFISTKQRDEIAKLISVQLEKYKGNTREVLESLGGSNAVHESFGGSIILTDSGEVLPSIGGTQEPTDTVTAQDDLTNDERLTLEQPGRYTIKGEQGRGGIGKVLVAFDSHLGREIAVKELIAFDEGANKDHPTPISQTAAMVARFLTEARITGQLEHPSIVPVYEIGKKSDGKIYYTMKLVKGETLADKLAKETDLEGRLKYLDNFVDLCNAIAYAHSRGVIHRDIKPQNVMIGEFGETVVLDWGLAKVKGHPDESSGKLKLEIEELKESSGFKTIAGRALGTPSYMPPEQAEGKLDEIDEQSDGYSLGAVLYEILTGKPPFVGTTVYEIISNVIDEEPENLMKSSLEIPVELSAICMKAISKKKSERYESAKDIADDIKKFMTGSLVSAYRYNPTERLKKWVDKNKPVVLTSFFALLILIVFGIFSWTNISQREKAIKNSLARTSFRLAKKAEAEQFYNKAYFYYANSILNAPNSSISEQARGLLAKEILFTSRLERTFKLEGITGKITRVLITHNEKYLVTILKDAGFSDAPKKNVPSVVIIWDLQTSKIIKKLNNFREVYLSDDGSYLILYNSFRVFQYETWHNMKNDKYYEQDEIPVNEFLVLNLNNFKESKFELSKSEAITNLTYKPKDGNIYFNIWNEPENKKSIFIFNIYLMKENKELLKKWKDKNTLAISPDGKFIAVKADGNITLYDFKSTKKIIDLGHYENVFFSSDGYSLVMLGKKTIETLDLNSLKIISSFKSKRPQQGKYIKFVKGLNWILYGNDNGGNIEVWNYRNAYFISDIDLPSFMYYPCPLTLSNDNLFLAVSRENNSVDISSFLITPTLEKIYTPVKTTALYFNKDSTKLLVAGKDQTINFWDIKNLKILRRYPKFHKRSFDSICFSPSSKYVLGCTSSYDFKDNLSYDVIYIIDWNTTEIHNKIDVKTKSSKEKQIITDEKNIVFYDNSGTVKIWDFNTLKEVGAIHRKQENSKKCVSLIPNYNDYLIVNDDKAELWNLQTMKKERTFPGTLPNENCIDSTGKRIAVVDDSLNKIMVLKTMTGEVIEEYNIDFEKYTPYFGKDGDLKILQFLGWENIKIKNLKTNRIEFNQKLTLTKYFNEYLVYINEDTDKFIIDVWYSIIIVDTTRNKIRKIELKDVGYRSVNNDFSIILSRNGLDLYYYNGDYFLMTEDEIVDDIIRRTGLYPQEFSYEPVNEVVYNYYQQRKEYFSESFVLGSDIIFQYNILKKKEVKVFFIKTSFIMLIILFILLLFSRKIFVLKRNEIGEVIEKKDLRKLLVYYGLFEMTLFTIVILGAFLFDLDQFMKVVFSYLYNITDFRLVGIPNISGFIPKLIKILLITLPGVIILSTLPFLRNLFLKKIGFKIWLTGWIALTIIFNSTCNNFLKESNLVGTFINFGEFAGFVGLGILLSFIIPELLSKIRLFRERGIIQNVFIPIIGISGAYFSLWVYTAFFFKVYYYFATFSL